MKYILVALLCFYNLIGYSQIHKFKAFESCLDESGGDKKTKDLDWTKVDILVVINFTKRKVKTYGEKEGDYDITMVDNVKNKNDDEVLVFHAVDVDGNECDILTTVFKGHNPEHWATMRIKYASIGDMVFKLKKDD